MDPHARFYEAMQDEQAAHYSRLSEISQSELAEAQYRKPVAYHDSDPADFEDFPF